MGVLRSEEGQKIYMVAERGKVIGRRQDAACKALRPQESRREDGFLARFSHRFAIGVLIDDCLPDDEDLEIFGSLKVTGDFLDGVPF